MLNRSIFRNKMNSQLQAMDCHDFIKQKHLLIELESLFIVIKILLWT